MKKILLIVVLFTLGASAILAQDSGKIEYENLAIGKDGFSVDVPKEFQLIRFDKEEDKVRFYGYYSPEFYLFIHSHRKAGDSPNKFLSDLASKNKAMSSELALENFEAKKHEFSDAEGFYQKIIIVPLKNRNLIFHSFSTTIENPSVKRFFSSLKFENVKIPSVLTEQFFNDLRPAENKILVPIVESEDKSVKKAGSGSGVGSGQGVGTDSGSGTTQSDNKEKKGATTGLKLLSKPRPAYTDLARFYNMQGTVTLRVTFLANGEIGSVSPVQKLPFGLTLNAIKAAKLLKFEPPQRNGVSYSVTKSVQFSFTIY